MLIGIFERRECIVRDEPGILVLSAMIFSVATIFHSLLYGAWNVDVASCDVFVGTKVPLDEDCVILSILLLSSRFLESARRQKNRDLPATSHVSLCSINRIELIDSKLKR